MLTPRSALLPGLAATPAPTVRLMDGAHWCRFGILLLLIAPSPTLAGAPRLASGDSFTASDTLNCGTESNADTQECLSKLSWTPAKFSVTLEPAQAGCGDFLVRFASPRPIGNATSDRVSMEWYPTRDEHGELRKAPAMVVIHESGRSMTVGRLIARGLSGQGLHTFLLHLPGYGARRVEPIEKDRILGALVQGIDDARRARDAVAALPFVDTPRIGLQGTSLGGFVTATVAGLDHGYHRTFILLAGGDLEYVIMHGAKDASKLHEKLNVAGVTEDQIKQTARLIEPLRLAHRIDPKTTWLFSGQFDDVVPPRCSLALATAAKLPAEHHVQFPADHYSGVIYLPQIMDQIRAQMIESPDSNTKPTNN